MTDFQKIEKKWQSKWEKSKIFQAKEYKKKKFYILEMYPYPSAAGLHMGHARNYVIGDIYARYKRMNNFNVIYPMGYDSFGLPAENAAIQAKSHPKIFTEKAIKNFIKQQKSLGLSYDWNRVIMSHNPTYYKWDQWLFLQLLKKGLAYKKKSAVNWCPKCNTVLANEQVINGKCWRHKDTNVEIKELNQWFFKITKYADKLLAGLRKLDWPEDIKTMQKNWIGKKKWIDIKYKIDKTDKTVTVSTTRPDTNFGATFVVIAPEHPLLKTKIIPKENRKQVDGYIKKTQRKSHEERLQSTDKTGVFTGLYCINQLTNKKMPLWVAEFVLMDVGTGIVVGVPGHDIRDFDFAKKYKLPIARVVVGSDGDKSKITRKEQVQEEEGTVINSDFLNGMDIHKATKKIMEYIVKKRWGKTSIRYRLHDWLISRQRYWGCPIPIIYCDKCGIVPDNKLPVKLPEKVSFNIKGNPLASVKSFVNTKCPKCKGPAKRETDTMDTFIDSSWYFLRYCDPKNSKKIFDPKKANYWMPIDQYIGGKEHATGHLIYFRFITKFLHDLKLLKTDEPAKKLFNQGMLHKGGYVMSKSRGNVVIPEEVSKKYGIDTARLFLTFVASPDKDMEWSEKGIQGMFRFVNKLLFLKNKKFTKESKLLTSKLNKTIKQVTEYIEKFQYNLAIINLMELTDYLHNEEISKNAFETLLRLITPFAPHIAEELWNKKSLISLEKWPKYNPKKIDKKIEAEYELIKKTSLDINHILRLIKEKPKTVYLYVIPKELKLFKQAENSLKKKLNLKIKVFAVNDKNKYDPQNKSKKAKPNKPAIFLE